MHAESALPLVESVIRDAIGENFRITSSTPASGGCTHTALTVSNGRERYFVKIAEADLRGMFQAEADGLAALAACNAFRTPAVVALGNNGEHACLVLEHLDLRPLQSQADGEQFASALVAQHRSLGSGFGWNRDNFLGLSPQINRLTPDSQHDNWPRFFAQCRLAPQLAAARENGFGDDLQRLGARVIARLPAMFLDYRPPPSLLHGDLWHGNAGMTQSGEPAVFDPAVYCGDREAELSMCELFGGFPTAFYAAYRRAWPLNEDFETRKPLYTLYHVLNHLNLFGRSYLGEAVRLVAKLDRALGSRLE